MFHAKKTKLRPNNDVATWLTIIFELDVKFLSLCVGCKRKCVVYLQRFISNEMNKNNKLSAADAVMYRSNFCNQNFQDCLRLEPFSLSELGGRDISRIWKVGRV